MAATAEKKINEFCALLRWMVARHFFEAAFQRGGLINFVMHFVNDGALKFPAVDNNIGVYYTQIM